MGRRTSGQQVGLQSIGNVQANANTLTTTQTNQNLTIAPNGTGTVTVQSATTFNGDMNIANQGDLRLLESSGNGTNYIAQQAAANMAANYTITWPAAVSGTNGFVLTSDTSGNLSWASPFTGIAVADPGASATVHYPIFGTNAGAVPSTLSPLARSNLSFVPSTGTLTATTFVGALTGNATSATSATTAGSATTATTASTANALATGNNYQMNSLGVGTAPSGTTGEIRATNQVTSFFSDERLKENILEITGALQKVMALRGVTYNANELAESFGYTNKEIQVGVLAGDVNKVQPEAVKPAPFDIAEDGSSKSGENYLTVQYEKLVPLLIEAIKELNREIIELKGVK
jgi:hypothetical protein